MAATRRVTYPAPRSWGQAWQVCMRQRWCSGVGFVCVGTTAGVLCMPTLSLNPSACSHQGCGFWGGCFADGTCLASTDYLPDRHPHPSHPHVTCRLPPPTHPPTHAHTGIVDSGSPHGSRMHRQSMQQSYLKDPEQLPFELNMLEVALGEVRAGAYPCTAMCCCLLAWWAGRS